MIWMMMALACAPKTQNVVENGPTSPIPVVGDARNLRPNSLTLLNSGARLWHLQDTGLLWFPFEWSYRVERHRMGPLARPISRRRCCVNRPGTQRSRISGSASANQLWANAGRRTELGFGPREPVEEGLPRWPM